MKDRDGGIGKEAFVSNLRGKGSPTELVLLTGKKMDIGENVPDKNLINCRQIYLLSLL